MGKRRKRKYWEGTEAEMAAALVESLRADGWTIYQEVPTPDGKGTVDVVAVRGSERRAYETKKVESLKVLEQAVHRSQWLPAYVVVPMPSPFYRTVCEKLGIGCVNALALDEWQGWTKKKVPSFTELVPAGPGDGRPGLVLYEKQQDYAAAGTSGTCWSDWKEWCERVERYVTEHPGRRPCEVVRRAGIAKYKESTLVHAVRTWKKLNIRIVKVGRLLRCFPPGTGKIRVRHGKTETR